MENPQQPTVQHNKTILVIEDDEVSRKLLDKTLRKDGFDVLSAENGEVGLRMALENKPDLILLDIIMPKLDGVGVIKELRQNRATFITPVILISNLIDDEKVAEAMKYGVCDYLVKSNWNLKDVLDRVKQKLNMV